MRAWALLLILVGCRAAKGEVDGGAAVFDAGARTRERWVLTPARVDAYLAYQRAILALDAGTASDLARGEEAARLSAGFDEEQLAWVEDLAAAIASQRLVERTSAADDLLPQIEKLARTLPAGSEGRAALEKNAAELRERGKARHALRAERAQYGEAAIEAMLAREPQLLRNWSLMLGEPPPPTVKRDGGE